MSDLTKFLLQAYVRKALAMLGTFLITHGILTPDSTDSFVATYVEEVVGALMVGGSATWTAAYQWYVKRKVKAALALPAGSTPKALENALEKEAA
jgi:hypothetical protein